MIKTDSTPRSGLEWVVPTIGAAALVGVCIVASPRRAMWFDELLTLYVIQDMSFGQMWAACGDQINTSPPLYFILAWIWGKAFGTSALALRMLSCLCMATGCVALWAALRKRYGFWAASLGAWGPLLLSGPFLLYCVETRFYGLLLGLTCFAIWHLSIVSNRVYVSPVWLILGALIHGAMVYTHLLGVAVSGALLAAWAAFDWRRERLAWRRYAAVALGWIVFLAYLPYFPTHMDMGRPVFWVPHPSLQDLINIYGFASSLPVLFAALWLLGMLAGRDDSPTDGADEERRASILPWIATMLFLLPLVVWIFSVVAKPIFLQRYLMPCFLAWPVVVAAWVKCPRQGENDGHRLWLSCTCFLLAAILAYPMWMATHVRMAPPDTRQESRFGHADLPIVMDDSYYFLPRYHYAEEPGRYVFVNDWEASLGKGNPRSAPSEFKMMAALKRHMSSLPVMETNEVFTRFPRFILLNRPRRRWLEVRLAGNPDYRLRQLGSTADGFRVILVERKSNP